MSIAILSAGLVLGLIATGLLHWWVLEKVFTIPAPRDGLPGQDGEGHGAPLHNQPEG
jgi:hypothetical protein